jgi:hypothetical protein
MYDDDTSHYCRVAKIQKNLADQPKKIAEMRKVTNFSFFWAFHIYDELVSFRRQLELQSHHKVSKGSSSEKHGKQNKYCDYLINTASCNIC